MIEISDESLKEKVEDYTERLLYASRWILSPIYLILILVLVLILFKFVKNVVGFIFIMNTLSYNEWIIQVLELLDLSLLANLVLIVAFSGYENFVSKIDVAEDHVDRPSWMGRLDFSGLKLKIIGSIVAISLVELLQDFLNVSSTIDPNVEFWRIALHLTFVATGLVFALMEILAEKRHEIKEETIELENENSE
ncbi:MAG: TIGR00645 family protein [Methanobrevibacter sp.]|uniref:TIGR00645 family protein n=1 Tax=Methanobrevibacter sp. TaxID=66852 RepID=UPI0025D21BB6|nr:TIGR00645 family protein [Methanobrevibacter sp.]MBQ6100587.1 TIGR00645 family protein [Methanobrevibacter sp.]MBQ6100618.1 TIGR00645 family protein [Methanobrevibacter sp.]